MALDTREQPEEIAAVEESRSEFEAGLAIPWEEVKRCMNERLASQALEGD